jgi:hypothetical protein
MFVPQAAGPEAAPDARPEAAAEAGPDAATEAEAGPPAVTVLVTSVLGAPLSNVAVVFHDATGAVLETKKTDTTGVASRVVDAGALVTVAVGNSSTRELVTYLGVKPGDSLTVVDRASFVPISVTISGPSSPPTGTLGYSFFAGLDACSGANDGPRAVLPLDVNCIAGAKFPVLAFARDGTGNDLGFAFKKDVMYTATAIDVSGLPAWSTTPSFFRLSVKNTAGHTGPIGTAFGQIANGIAYTQTDTFNVDGNRFDVYPGYADAFQWEANVRGTLPTAQIVNAVVQRGPTTLTNVTVDLAMLLPDFTGGAIDTSDVSRPSITWTTSATLAGMAVGGGAMLTWTATDADGGTSIGAWAFVLPPAATTVKAPAMPPELAAWIPSAAVVVDPPLVLFIASDAIASYDAFRAGAATSLSQLNPAYEYADAEPTLPVDGLARVTWLLPPALGIGPR